MEIKQCRGVDLDIAEDHIMHMNECLKEAGAKEVAEIEPTKMPVRIKLTKASDNLFYSTF